MNDFFKTHPKAIIGMVHCLPLPGTVNFKDNLATVRAQALADATTLFKAGVDAIMIENMGDEPYGITMELEQTAALAAIAEMIKKEVPLPLGIDCAFSDYKSSLAIAKAVGAEFVRIPVYVDTVIYGNGIINPSARDAQLYRRKINGEHIKIMADLQVKHTFMLNSAISVLDSLHLAEAAFADAVVITGSVTGSSASIDDLITIKKHAKVPRRMPLRK